MTQVMDGVRRSSGVPSGMTAALAVPARPKRPQQRPLSAATRRSTAGVRYMTGIDGVRRAVPATTTPRHVLQNLSVPPAPAAPITALEAAAAVMTPAVSAPAGRRPLARPMIAFGLVATTLVAAGGGAYIVNSQQPVAAQATQGTAPSVQQAPSTPAAAVVPAVPARQAELQQLVDGFVASRPAGMYGIVVKDLNTGATASSGADRQLTSASLYKLFVAQQIYRLVDTGQLSYGAPAGGGTGYNVENCLKVMINVSDNACGRALGNIVGWGKQNAALHNAGYTATSLAAPQQTSARDVATLLERLYAGTLNAPSSNARFMDLLKDQRVNNRLPKGLPAGTVIAHKTGDLDGYVHDAGIVYGPKTNYLVVVTSGQWVAPGAAPSQFATLSSKLWNFFEN